MASTEKGGQMTTTAASGVRSHGRGDVAPKGFSARLLAWGTLSALPAPAAVAVIAALTALSWAVAIPLGGAGLVAPHWFYIPIFMSGLRFGPFGALVAGSTSMLAAGPLLPLSFNPTTAQATSDWVSRGIFFIVIGIFVTMLFGAVRSLSAHEANRNGERAVREVEADTLRQSEQRFRSLVQRASDMILVVDPGGTYASESPAVERLLGWEHGHRLGMPTIGFVHPDDRGRASTALEDILSDPGKSCTVELRLHDSSGRWHWVESTITNMVDEPTVRGIVFNDRLVDERKALQEELTHRALHDPLTGLANRSLLRQRLEAALVRPDVADRPPALLFIDLDDFKLVNDSHGHDAGDLLLIEIANRLRSCARPEDLVARFGGDEFAVLTKEDADNRSTATDIAECILHALLQPFSVAGCPTEVAASIGIASYRDGESDADQMLRHADIAMYRAKDCGKSRSVVFTDGLGEYFRGRARTQPEVAGLRAD
ncbi:MAG TPA: diguanylate cyclase [Acidimicrobiales bacterium]|nr:diguanylate cyclase [Acidimicrobiales bacterium]